MFRRLEDIENSYVSVNVPTQCSIGYFLFFIDVFKLLIF